MSAEQMNAENDALRRRVHRLERENADLRRLNESLAERVAAQSELLSRRAEK